MSTTSVLTGARMRWALAAGAAAAAGYWWFGDKAPYPYAQCRLLDLPLPFLTSDRLDTVLEPRRGERILEVGPGTGLQSLHIAPQLGPQGRLDVLDVQSEMLDHVMRRAAEQELDNVFPTRSDARELPFEDGTFDAMYLVTALGEIPEPERVLSEAARVLAPGGRLVVGEFFDRHWIPFGRLHRLADSSGLHLQTRSGSTLAYLARFSPCAAGPGSAEPSLVGV
ncbi:MULTISPECIES: class I SAM-dependent methyltransferase [Streptomycetaceae]|uniref:Methyltransferase type 11 n=1 Tax=Streptantibioticus cattleyicolor (strain ATCC 35852 / DSM 46488 / JCM 4925 / NBRC 14057 / NRRL 8057) TaxID=1003195 RepID=F8JTU3_STREN|nr:MULTISPECIES: methyltransferase domain-containing protein [Streptomycetaceae]AEW98032.1 Methyltransferase type 11 [Streptantibioticus cattleyicolor NRRL 8057 = DSM 46488]MYS62427.1 methyltransferase domain-containing protein [Streptomyces sp. SID5468]CCB78349.1 Methyltransferase type 11 [Streptantibioticus cattleyicolor NRRL 8057 = DSM 46488]